MFSTAEVARLVGLTPHDVRMFVRANLAAPGRRADGGWIFGFQDLVLLRTAKKLRDRSIPYRQIRSTLKKLADQLPDDRPLSAVPLEALGGQVVVHDEDGAWHPESGQFAFDFDQHGAAGATPLGPALFSDDDAEPAAEPEGMTAEDWFELGSELESHTVQQARDAYRRALELDPSHFEAHLNTGRILHELGLMEAAAAHYRASLATRPGEPVPQFNLGVALEDLEDWAGAVTAYKETIETAPLFRDAYLNLSRLYEKLGDKQRALQTLKAYREITE